MTKPYTVRSGDTASGIVARYNRTHSKKMTVGQFAKKFNIKDPNKIRAGDKYNLDVFERPTAKPTQTKQPARKRPVSTGGETPVSTGGE